MEIDGPFGLSIDLTERERSKDSHTNTFHVEVDGSAVRYDGPYGEGIRGRFETRTVEFELTDEQRADLRTELDNYDLRRSVTETFETDARGPRRSIDAEATVVVDGKRHDLRVAGTTNVRGERTEMEHRKQALGLKTICFRFKRWAEAAGEGSRWNPFG